MGLYGTVKNICFGNNVLGFLIMHLPTAKNRQFLLHFSSCSNDLLSMEHKANQSGSDIKEPAIKVSLPKDTGALLAAAQGIAIALEEKHAELGIGVEIEAGSNLSRRRRRGASGASRIRADA